MTDAELLRRIAAKRRLKVLFIGQCDSGKTTLIAQAARHNLSRSSVSIVDADVGQSHIGPPTTIGWARVTEGFTSLSDLKGESMYFVGSTSPQYHLLPTALGILKMTARAACAADKVLIDTPGFVRGEAARRLFWHVIDSLQPEIVVAVQQFDELDHIISAYTGSSWPQVIRVAPSPRCVQKTRQQRAEHREALFRKYFAGSRDITLCWDEIPVRARAIIDENTAPAIVDRLISLRDSIGEDVALGIISRVDPEKHEFAVRAPLAESSSLASAVLGSIRLTPDGKEIPWPEGTTVPVP